MTNQISALQAATSSGQNSLKDQVTEKIGEIVKLQDEIVTIKSELFKTKSAKEQLESASSNFEELIVGEKRKLEILLEEQKSNKKEIKHLQSEVSLSHNKKLEIEGNYRKKINELEKKLDLLKKDSIHQKNEKEQNQTLIHNLKNQLEKVMAEATEAENSHLKSLKDKDNLIDSMERDLSQERFK